MAISVTCPASSSNSLTSEGIQVPGRVGVRRGSGAASHACLALAAVTRWWHD